jgi:hypothetical protein
LTVKERKVLTFTENSITVRLEPNVGKQCDRYLLRISSPDLGTTDTKELVKNASILTHEFRNLTESTVYNIFITVFAGNYSDNGTKALLTHTRKNIIFHTLICAITDFYLFNI